MAGEEDKDGGKFEDLFDDLDKFFTPAERTERARAREAARTASDESGLRAKTDEPPSEEDLLPPGWEPDVEGMDVTVLPDKAEEPEAPSASEEPVVIVPPESSEPPAGSQEPVS